VSGEPVIRHAGLIARRIAGRWKGALIEGPSGSGKSDLALRALGQGFRLVADDRVLLWADDGRLWGRAPDTLAGLIELRGLDVVRVEPVAFAEVVLIARLETPDRIPEPRTEQVLGVVVPRLALAPFEATAPAKLSRAIETFDAVAKGRI
jgi:serine kinase of HPr protein (carbohydrate metabolism regulator)